MPWEIERRNGQFCIIKYDGTTETCHDRREDAIDHLRALYASEGKGSKSLIVFKERGQWGWLAAYSNNVRDNDYPRREIISASSHKRFVQKVAEGEYPLPDLWIWHKSQWRIGKATHVWNDEHDGILFAMASGIFYPWANSIAESLAKSGGLDALSHGMPYVKYAPDDNTIIVEHQTREISLLPIADAANKLTYPVLLKESKQMSDEKREALLAMLGLDDVQLKRIEELNANVAELVKGLGLEFKASGKAEEATPEPEQADKQASEEVADDGGGDDGVAVAKLQKEVQEAFAEVAEQLKQRDAAVAEALRGITEQVAQIGGVVENLRKSDAERVAQKAANTPTASLVDILRGSKSPIGDDAARVDGRTKEGRDGPVQVQDTGDDKGLFFSGWVNN